MEVLINGKHHTHTDNPVTAYDVCGNPHTIKPIDYHLYNFTSFTKLIIDGVEISPEGEEGMERLTYNPCDECPYGIDRRDGSGNDNMCKICEFEAQQQEIAGYKQNLKIQEAITLREMKKVDKLTKDKDEQAGRIMQYKSALKNMYFAYQNKDPDCPHDFEIKAIEQYNALLGGTEDGK